MSVPTPLTGNLQSLRTRVREAEQLASELEQVETGTPTEVRNFPTPHNVGTGRLSDGWQAKFDQLDALLTEIARLESGLAALFATLKADFPNIT